MLKIEESISQHMELQAPIVAAKTVQIINYSIVNLDDEGSSSDVEEAQEISQQLESIETSRSKREIHKPIRHNMKRCLLMDSNATYLFNAHVFPLHSIRQFPVKIVQKVGQCELNCSNCSAMGKPGQILLPAPNGAEAFCSHRILEEAGYGKSICQCQTWNSRFDKISPATIKHLSSDLS
ncbi:hypothetical protein F0562_003226 [Nyssa sinensis]|uniref:Uncharacterized protein n=1 Tax=Nyssa sinensis TaxID=561372 RepID=A0A5J5BYL2_9ASTE|nr:hypothetical protein F0562_003226 [Nyssa sinensis]